MESEIDEQAYQLGKQAFDAGASLRSILAACHAQPPADEEKTFSSLVGYVDGAFDQLRAISKALKAS
ncbi:hypothetical protein [Bradyrhizobium japonicum]|uniref:hypothetical protein n=1 Tax=Bradyrhizobium japonicum TaxID=375 RepID=UPI001BAD3FD1|nr:hypothetical protein [Bradyrhizobium japonicum]MBR0962245.1 hypothetical protein [Bradyrhizobium japonicum]